MMTADAVGGVWRHALDLSAGLAKDGWRITLAVSGPAPDDAQHREAAAIAGLDVIVTGLDLDWLVEDEAALDFASERLASLARDLEADLVHLHSPSEVGRAAWGPPVVVTIHSCLATWWKAVRGSPPPAEWQGRIARTKRGLEAADAVLCPSRAFAAMVAEAYGAHLRPLAVHNAAAPPDAPGATKRDMVLAAGRLWDDAKNVALLDRLGDDLPWPVIAAGSTEGPNGARLEASRLRLAGALPHADLRALMREAAIFAAPAFYEPFGLAVLEAAQSGCALVLSDIPTFRELWDGAAIFADPRDEAAWRDALRRAIRDADLRSSLAEAARERAGRYTLAAQGAAVRGVYAKVLADARGLRRAV